MLDTLKLLDHTYEPAIAKTNKTRQDRCQSVSPAISPDRIVAKAYRQRFDAESASSSIINVDTVDKMHDIPVIEK